MGDAELERLSGSAVELERLARLLGDPELQWLITRVRRRLELGQPLTGSVTLGDASPAQRRAAQRLLGRRPRAGRALSVPLDVVDEVVRRSRVSPDGLAAAVIALTGPVVVRAEANTAERLAWERAFAPLEELVGGRIEVEADGSEQLASWLRQLRRSGIVKRMRPDPGDARILLERLATVLTALPADGEPLGGFAARAAGGAHALDEGEPLATLALGAVRALAGLNGLGLDESRSESRREAWGSVGLLCDELSSVVLTLGLPGGEETGSGRILRAAQRTGQPCGPTLRQLVRDPPEWMTASPVAPSGIGGCVRRQLRGADGAYLREPGTIVALAADRLGEGCLPLVCTGGQPGAATMLLLRALVAAGARLAHHGDFDWGGIPHRQCPACWFAPRPLAV